MIQKLDSKTATSSVVNDHEVFKSKKATATSFKTSTERKNPNFKGGPKGVSLVKNVDMLKKTAWERD